MAANTRIALRMEKAEKAFWNDKARLDGRTLTNWIRHTVRKAIGLDDDANFNQPHQGPRGKKKTSA